MFGKNFLFSTLGLFFLSTKLVLVNADCTVTGTKGGTLTFTADCKQGYYTSDTDCSSSCESQTLSSLAAGSATYLYYCSAATTCEIKSAGAYYSSNLLIKCDANSCKVTSHSDEGIKGYYINKGTEKDAKPLIYCSGNSTNNCKVQEGTSGGYYVNAGFDKSTNKLIHCTGTTSCESIQGSTGYYENSGADNASNQLINCGNTCDTKAASIGYYLNMGDTTKRIITCTAGTTCSTGAAETSCTANEIGKIYESDSKFYLCVSTTTASDNIEIKVGATASTKVITKAKFPGTTNSVVDNTVNINADGSVTYQKCTSDGSGSWSGCTAGAYYLSVTDCSNTACFTDLSLNNSASSSPSLFYCTSSTSCSKEENITGLSYLNNDTIITCSASACTSTAFSSANSGYYVNGGKDKSTKPLIYCNGSSSCETKAASIGYYLSGSDKDADADEDTYSNVIKCDNDVCSVSDHAPTKVGAYVNGDGAITNNSEIIYKKLINLATSKFSEKNIAEIDAGVYLDAGDGKNVIICTYDDTNKGACTSKVGNKNKGYGYIDANTSGNIIVCTESSCSSLPNGNAQAAANNKPVQNASYIDASVTGDATIITCTKDTEGTTCTSTSFPSTSTKYAFLDGSTYDSGFKNLLVYDSSDKKIKQLSPNSIYTDGIAYIDGSDTEHKRIIKCSSATSCEASANGSDVTTNIFFINGVDQKEYVVCTSTEGCVSKPGTATTSNSDNYYPDSLNSGKIIKCLSKNGNCSQESHNGVAADYTYYLDGFNPSKVLECQNDKICTENEGLSTNGYAYIDAVTKGNVIICKSNAGSATPSTKSSKRDGNNSSSTTTCSSQSSGAKPADTTAKTT
ncbi:scaffoldin, partial [Anaeromyces robustus]